MSLNIKKQRVHDLAREAANREHTSQTSAIERALEYYLASLDDDPRADRLRGILADFDAALSDEDRAALTTDWLYDDAGLPA